MRPFDIITFDCYGTLIDWEAGITKAFQDAAAADGVSLDSAAVLRALFDTRSASEAPEYRSYRDILTDAAVRVGGRLGWSIDRARAAFLPESLPHWMPFADTNPALTRPEPSRPCPRHPIERGRRPTRGDVAAPRGELRLAYHRAGGALLQAGSWSLRKGAKPDRSPAMASCRAKLLPRCHAGRRA